VRALSGQYLAALLGSVERRNCRRLPEQRKERALDGVQPQAMAAATANAGSPVLLVIG
jgi:hypothetical protein